MLKLLEMCFSSPELAKFITAPSLLTFQGALLKKSGCASAAINAVMCQNNNF